LQNGNSNQIKVSTENKKESFPDLLDRAFDEAAKAETMQGGHHKQINITFEAVYQVFRAVQVDKKRLDLVHKQREMRGIPKTKATDPALVLVKIFFDLSPASATQYAKALRGAEAQKLNSLRDVLKHGSGGIKALADGAPTKGRSPGPTLTWSGEALERWGAAPDGRVRLTVKRSSAIEGRVVNVKIVEAR
jgi:hypothetical protein